MNLYILQAFVQYYHLYVWFPGLIHRFPTKQVFCVYDSVDNVYKSVNNLSQCVSDVD